LFFATFIKPTCKSAVQFIATFYRYASGYEIQNFNSHHNRRMICEAHVQKKVIRTLKGEIERCVLKAPQLSPAIEESLNSQQPENSLGEKLGKALQMIREELRSFIRQNEETIRRLQK